jgi:hypothetical protein
MFPVVSTTVRRYRSCGVGVAMLKSEVLLRVDGTTLGKHVGNIVQD